MACHAGQLRVVRMMLGRGVVADTQAGDGATPLFAAAQNGHVAVRRAKETIFNQRWAAIDAAGCLQNAVKDT